MAAVELRPLSLGQVLDRTFSLYRSNFWLFVGVMAVPLCSLLLFAPLFAFLGLSDPRAFANVANPQILMGRLFLLLLPLFCIFFAIYMLAAGAVTYAVSDTSLGRPSTIRGAYGKVFGNFWRLIGLTLNILLRMILVAIVVALAAGVLAGAFGIATRATGTRIAAVVFGFAIFLAIIASWVGWIWFGLRYSLSISTLLLEDAKIGEAIRRSVELTRGSRGRIFVAFLLCAIIGYVGVIIFQGPFLIAQFLTLSKGQPPVWLSALGSVAGMIGGAVTGPITMIALVLCYYDLRIRKEAFDLQYKMASLAPDPPPSAPPGAPPLGAG